ncbi:T6SS phospholipase effector Tle1-like catalytic domain-containing protein [Parasphingopyxis marina]|uniref:DUF2235 domain-containing protein n=1 Tax=Parasphingopyxis marina TaxID=2761622 RepID=A0A842HVN7_9SPHN|nr:DUF2235 domain-containing protein [Parasphingopyxis marina]MBC2776497.1 DUF2235 domain-containing protein [Parasphingopyxis marina]
MRRIAFCFDGTWNKIDGAYPTNVARVSQSISRRDPEGNPQIIHYDEGVGTTRTARLTGGIFGHGLKDNVIEAYHFLVLNYEPGDEIYVFGFSRGAFTARSFVGLVRNCGIVSRRSLHHIRAAFNLYLSRDKEASPGSELARQFRFEHCPMLCLPGDKAWRKKAHDYEGTDHDVDLAIKYVGVWDTVGALGIPNNLRLLRFLNKKYQFHDTALSSFVKRARHAVAADEKRKTFEPSLWSNLADLNAASDSGNRYEQIIFPGTHSAVGGGGPVRGLSDAALEWIFNAARREGLAFDVDSQSPLYDLKPNHRAQLFNANGKLDWSWKDRLVGVGLGDRHFTGIDRTDFHKSLVRRFHTDAKNLPEVQKYRPPSLKEFWPALEEMKQETEIEISQALLETKSLWDDRNLRVPDKVRSYVIKPGDTAQKIATAEMNGPEDAAILLLHNLNIGALFDPDELYVGVKIELPTYSELEKAS